MKLRPFTLNDDNLSVRHLDMKRVEDQENHGNYGYTSHSLHDHAMLPEMVDLVHIRCAA
jgi:hypothetical protein